MQTNHIEKVNILVIFMVELWLIILSAKREKLGLFQEVKWTKVTEQYLDKYLILIDYFFFLILLNLIKLR